MNHIDEIRAAIALDPDEPSPIYYTPVKDKTWHTFEVSSPLGLAMFGLGWDEEFWFYKSSKRNGIDHHDSDFWRVREPDWNQVRTEIRRATNYNPAFVLPLL